MNTNDEQLLWRYIDGACTPEEMDAITQRMETDPAFRMAMAERRALHRQLGELPIEQPPLRFVRNVMEQLPALYGPLRMASLITPRQWKIGLSGTGLFLAFLISIPFWLPNPPQANNGQPPLVRPLAEFFNGLPQSWLLITSVLGLAFLLLYGLDRQLKKRFRMD